ncbi:MAG: hypothetical protein ABSE56_06645 [Bryobacteraceae bacterium]|jgi:hypothetical protein
MGEFWAGTLIGFLAGIVASILANYHWDLRARRRAYKAAGKLVGTWVAYNIHGRTIDTTPMQGADLTVVSSKPHWWAADSGVLDVRAQDTDDSTGRTRKHAGTIVLDPANPWLATRIVRYADSNEVSHQRLEFDPADCNVVYVFPDPTVATLGDVYGKHAWRRKC